MSDCSAMLSVVWPLFCLVDETRSELSFVMILVVVDIVCWGQGAVSSRSAVYHVRQGVGSHCLHTCSQQSLSCDGIMSWPGMSGQVPLYLADDCCLVSDSTRCSLQSADVLTCVMWWTCSSYIDRTFAATGPRLWNSLPVQLCNPDITYRWQLKGHLFWEAWTRRSVTSEKHLLAYLLTYGKIWQWMAAFIQSIPLKWPLQKIMCTNFRFLVFCRSVGICHKIFSQHISSAA